MPKAGARAAALDRALQYAGLRTTTKPPRPRLEDLPNCVGTEVRELYRQLGGVLDEPVFRPGAWDLAYTSVIVELDEDMHFNRYRATTLQRTAAETLPWASAYRGYAASHEGRCGTGGRRWTSPPAERMFGRADPHCVFEGNGAPRWKQRALYDAMKDAVATAGAIRLARLSIYDHIDGVLIEDYLRGRVPIVPDRLRALVDSRTYTGSAPPQLVLPPLDSSCEDGSRPDARRRRPAEGNHTR